MKKKDIIDAYCKVRTIDHTIPDDVLDFMKQAAIEKLESEKFYTYDDLDLVRRRAVEMGVRDDAMNTWFNRLFPNKNR